MILVAARTPAGWMEGFGVAVGGGLVFSGGSGDFQGIPCSPGDPVFSGQSGEPTFRGILGGHGAALVGLWGPKGWE